MKTLLDALFPPGFSYPADAAPVLFSLPGKTVLPFALENREGLARAVEALVARREDVYLHVAMHDASRFAPRGRGSNESAVALTALFDDVDMLIPGHRHKGAKLPTTLEEARAFLDLLPWRPSLVVHSGFGLQPYWLFREPLLLDDAGDRALAEMLLARYRQHRDVLAALRGWTFDAVHDLARVLRLPGTRNFKNPDAVKNVTILEETGIRYNPSELLDELPPLDVRPPVSSGATALSGDEKARQARGLVTAACRRASEQGRNPSGLWLGCQLRDSGLTFEETLEAGAPYVAFVDRTWPDRDYGRLQEFAESVRQAFRRPPRGTLPTLADMLSVELVRDAREKTCRRLARELYFRRVDDELTTALVCLANETKCRPALTADELARILDEEQTGVASRRAGRAS